MATTDSKYRGMVRARPGTGALRNYIPVAAMQRLPHSNYPRQMWRTELNDTPSIERGDREETQELSRREMADVTGGGPSELAVLALGYLCNANPGKCVLEPWPHN